jgi:6-phosphogluconolactonase (cycloisomerase 2 family)
MNPRLGSRTPLAGGTRLHWFSTAVVSILAALLISCGGGSSSHPTHNAYISLTSADTVALFHITDSSGALSSVSNSVPQVKTGPVGLALHPSGKFLFAANSTDGTVSTFNVGSDGTLTQAGNATPAGAGARAAVIDPSGQSLLVTNSISNSISVFSIDSGSGALTLTSTFNTGLFGPTEIVMTSSNFVYVLTPSTNNTVNGFSFSGGNLTPIGSFLAGRGTTGIAVDPSGQLLYTANSTDATVSAFTIDAGGVLNPIVGSPYLLQTGVAPGALAVDTTGKFLYVATPGSTNSIWVFSITPGSGILQPAANSPFSLTAGTLFLIMEPRGKFFYIGSQSGHNIAAYSYDSSTGKPTAITGSPFSTGSTPGRLLITH